MATASACLLAARGDRSRPTSADSERSPRAGGWAPVLQEWKALCSEESEESDANAKKIGASDVDAQFEQLFSSEELELKLPPPPRCRADRGFRRTRVSQIFAVLCKRDSSADEFERRQSAITEARVQSQLELCKKALEAVEVF